MGWNGSQKHVNDELIIIGLCCQLNPIQGHWERERRVAGTSPVPRSRSAKIVVLAVV